MALRPFPLVVLAGLGGLCVQAQVPHFADGTAFGGSRVFSEGLNPMGNPARFDQAKDGVYLSYLKGDQGSKDIHARLEDLASLDAARTQAGLTQLKDFPWAARSRAMAISYADTTVHTSFTREETTGLLGQVLSPTGPLASNESGVLLRHTSVDRLLFGAGSREGDFSMGFTLRVERWRRGQTRLAQGLYTGTAYSPLAPGVDPLDFKERGRATTAASVDFGFTWEVLQGVRLGGTMDRTLAKRLWDVKEQPQARLGLQIDLGDSMQLAVESDLNKAWRLPLEGRQQASAISLRVSANQHFTIKIGAERVRLEAQSVQRGGLTVIFRALGWDLGAGFQVSEDRPLQGGYLAWR